MKKYPGHGGSHYDSKDEGQASYRLAELGFLRSSKQFKTDFYDADNRLFNAKLDFYHAGYGIALEFKAAGLNGVKTKATSESQLDKQRQRRGFTIMKDNLDFVNIELQLDAE